MANVLIGALRPDGRYEIPADDAAKTFLLEVPKGLVRRELLAPGQWRWVIMGSPRFDRALKSLVLVAADIEARYIIEK